MTELLSAIYPGGEFCNLANWSINTVNGIMITGPQEVLIHLQ